MADNEEDVITLISILEDKVTHDDAVKLLRQDRPSIKLFEFITTIIPNCTTAFLAKYLSPACRRDRITSIIIFVFRRSARGDVNLAISIFFDGGLQQDNTSDPRSPVWVPVSTL
jgi:hypothetical protein